MGTWDEHLETCMHGVTEGLDSHPCLDCRAIAERLGYSLADGRTYLFYEDPDKDALQHHTRKP